MVARAGGDYAEKQLSYVFKKAVFSLDFKNILKNLLPS
jgi:hypothetical protein